MFKIIVCIKAVPDPKDACNIKIDPATKTLMRCDVPLVLNTLDKNALETSFQLKRDLNAHIAVLSMGPPEAGNIVKECLALGADEGYLLSDQAFGGADAYSTAFTLAAGIRKIGLPDLILCGMASSDGATEWVGPELSVFLDMPVVTMVREIVECKGRWCELKASLENGYRLVRIKLPAVLTVTREINRPGNLSFSGILKARKKQITVWGIDQLGLIPESVGLKGSPTIVSEIGIRESKRQVQIIKGTREEKADRLLQKLVDQGLL